MRTYVYNKKVYDLDILLTKTLPRLLDLLEYIKSEDLSYFSKEELLGIYRSI